MHCFLLGPADSLEDEAKACVMSVTKTALATVEVFTSEEIEMNRVEHDNAARWRYLRVIVFQGKLVATIQSAG